MGIRFYCPNGHKLNVKVFQAGRKGICPYCGSKFVIPTQSTRKSSKEERSALRAIAASPPIINAPSPNIAAEGRGDLPAPTLESTEAMEPVAPLIIDPIINPPSTDTDISSMPSDLSSLPVASEIGPDLPVLPARKKWAVKEPKAMPADNAQSASKPLVRADPLIEAGNVVWYVRPLSGGQYGPATSNIMRQWLTEGRVSPDTLVWREGWRDWQQAGEVFPQLQNKDAPAEMAKSDEPAAQPISSLIRQEIGRQTPQNMLRLIVIFIVLTVIIITGLLVWAFFPR